MVCLNCNNTYEGAYCPHCGQSAKTKRLRLIEMVNDFIGSFVGGRVGSSWAGIHALSLAFARPYPPRPPSVLAALPPWVVVRHIMLVFTEIRLQGPYFFRIFAL